MLAIFGSNSDSETQPDRVRKRRCALLLLFGVFGCSYWLPRQIHEIATGAEAGMHKQVLQASKTMQSLVGQAELSRHV